MNVEDHIDWARSVALQYRRERNIPIEYEEAISLGMLGLMRAAKVYREGKAKFRSFAWNRVRGELRDWVRASLADKRVGEVVSLEYVQLSELLSTNGTEKKVADEELIRKMLEFTTLKQTRAIILYYLEQYTMREVAEKCNVTEGNISLLIWTGIGRIRKAMKLGYV